MRLYIVCYTIAYILAYFICPVNLRLKVNYSLVNTVLLFCACASLEDLMFPTGPSVRLSVTNLVNTIF